MNSERFINPYNFVPLVGKCQKEKRNKGNLTGKITCTLETKTPLFIPTANEESSDFFHYDDEKIPVIPGSELRGTIRSVFEAAFNGCLSQVNTEYFHRRSKDIKYPGIIRKTEAGWELQKCKKGKIDNKPGIQEGMPAFYNVLQKKKTSFTIESKERQRYRNKGFIHIGEQGPDGIAKFIFAPIGKAIKVECLEIERLEQILLLYNNNDEHSGYHEYMKLFKKIKDQQSPLDKDLVLPVYYYENNGVVGYLAPAAISQEVFMKTLQTILGVQGSYSPCECSTKICPVCNLFGFVSKADARASRVRFGDAMITTNPPFYESTIRLPALGAPKPGAVEFYTEVPANIRENYWTYDYYKIGKKRISLKPGEIKIRGRKFYWHHEVDDDLLKPINPKEEIPEMECNVKPLKKNHKFVFTVFFEQLTEDELRQLCWVLDFGGSESHAHKIGKAKPLGFGSAQIKIDKIMTRTIDKKSGQWTLNEYKHHLYTVETNDEMKILLDIMQYPAKVQGKVQYPKVSSKGQGVNDAASHKWFTKNMEGNRFKQVLPTIKEELEPTSVSKWLQVKPTNK
ncbi:TIGR03986 family CRISPR-associated RAMP protein [Lysinibacillus sp. FSL H8-0500]|uniref:TIGR03986 family type III CRISPR-associated RAMP protein n=1 Tax=Lysinibacillus sp. FSL H8-0500 TaxID=2921393 RepID=UPI0031015FA5